MRGMRKVQVLSRGISRALRGSQVSRSGYLVPGPLAEGYILGHPLYLSGPRATRSDGGASGLPAAFTVV